MPLPIPSKSSRRGTGKLAGFSLVELLISISVLAVLLLMIISLLDKTQQTWGAAKTRVTQFRDARIAFESLTRNLSQATLNTYLEYYDSSGNRMLTEYGRQGGGASVPIQPAYYDRFSDLHFLVDYADSILPGNVPSTTHAIFFQAPLGDTEEIENKNLGNALNGRGYFVVLSDNTAQMPGFLRSVLEPKYRFRLMEFRPPSEQNLIFNTPDNFNDWRGANYGDLMKHSRVIADNIIALIISPIESLEDVGGAVTARTDIAPEYSYDSQNPLDKKSRHQLPPLVRVTMVAIDEDSALRLGIDGSTTPTELVPGNLFRQARSFDADLEELEEYLVNDLPLKINFRVFSAIVGIRGSKWSDESLVQYPGG